MERLQPRHCLLLRQTLKSSSTTTSARLQPFSTTPTRPSQIGRTPLSIPPEVTFTITRPRNNTRTTTVPRSERRDGGASPTVSIKGPRGELSMTVPAYLKIEHDELARKATLKVTDREERRQREMWGTVRAYLQNHILGVSEGHSTILRLVGVGYRATIESSASTKQPEYPGQQFVSLKVGYSHPIELGVPREVKASTPQPTRILLEGIEKEVVNSFAAQIRKWRVPEPYKGKGIFVNDETIKLKAKKIK